MTFVAAKYLPFETKLPKFLHWFLQSSPLEFLLRLATHRFCLKLGQDVIGFLHPASTAKDDAPDHQVPENVEHQRDIGSSFLGQ